jgi:hypothetical protein
MLIPTLYKVRLPREFSYPIGAQALSEQLADVPHFADFRICFSDLVSAWKSKFQRIIAERSDYEIVRVRLWAPFEISVYPVQRILKHTAHELVLSQGLPKLRAWIVQRGNQTSMTFASCSIIFSPSTGTVHTKALDHVA